MMIFGMASVLNRKQLLETIEGLHRQVAALEKLGGYRTQIAACQKAIQTLTELLVAPQN